MALSKTAISTEGFSTNYHKIDEVCIKNNILSCVVGSYVSKEYRELNQPAKYYFFDFNITLEEEESMGIRQLAYKKIKELEEWKDAIDC